LKPGAPEESYAWFAGEKADAAGIRQLYREEWGIPRERSYVAAYWTKSE
jgi:NADPH-dependent ferric siderophore reductase